MKHKRFMMILYGVTALLNGTCSILYSYQGKWILGSLWMLAALCWSMSFDGAIKDYIDLKESRS